MANQLLAAGQPAQLLGERVATSVRMASTRSRWLAENSFPLRCTR